MVNSSMDRKGKEYHIGKETFRVYSVDGKLIIERLWGEWIHDFTPSYTEKFFLHMITIEKELIPVLILSLIHISEPTRRS